MTITAPACLRIVQQPQKLCTSATLGSSALGPPIATHELLTRGAGRKADTEGQGAEQLAWQLACKRGSLRMTARAGKRGAAAI